MTTDNATDPADALLRAQVIDDDGVRAMDLRAGFDDLLRGIDTQPRRDRRRMRLIAGGAATTAALLVGGVAAATGHTALTGVFGQPGMTENDTSQYVDVTAPDFPALVRRLAHGLDVHGLVWAPGVDERQQVERSIVLMSNTKGLVPARPVLMQVTGVEGDVAGLSICGWQSAWLTAYDGGDAAGQRTALAGWKQVAMLPVVAKVNDRHWQLETIDQVEHGDTTRLRFLVSQCSGARK